jgi:hypothetical protein
MTSPSPLDEQEQQIVAQLRTELAGRPRQGSNVPRPVAGVIALVIVVALVFGAMKVFHGGTSSGPFSWVGSAEVAWTVNYIQYDATLSVQNATGTAEVEGDGRRIRENLKLVGTSHYLSYAGSSVRDPTDNLPATGYDPDTFDIQVTHGLPSAVAQVCDAQGCYPAKTTAFSVK